MSEISLILVLLKKTNKTLNDMAKVQIKSEKLTPFGVYTNLKVYHFLIKKCTTPNRLRRYA